jgi:hypothetical protein
MHRGKNEVSANIDDRLAFYETSSKEEAWTIIVLLHIV